MNIIFAIIPPSIGQAYSSIISQFDSSPIPQVMSCCVVELAFYLFVCSVLVYEILSISGMEVREQSQIGFAGIRVWENFWRLEAISWESTKVHIFVLINN